MSRTIRSSDIRAVILSALVGKGLAAIEAEKLAETCAKALKRQYSGDRTYWAIEKVVRHGMDVATRKAIFMEWWLHGDAGEHGDGILVTRGISVSTLERIKREGRKSKWAA